MNIFVISAFFFTLILHAGNSFSLVLFLEIFGIFAICAITGSAFLNMLKIKTIVCYKLLNLMLGIIISSLFINTLSQPLGIPALQSFLLMAALVVIPTLLVSPYLIKENFIFSMEDRYDSIVFFGVIVFVGIWCWDVASSFPALQKTGMLHAWEDYFDHGAQLAQFYDPKAVGQGDIHLVGTPLSLYHRSMYMLPAVIAGVANLTGVAASTAVLFPLGILLMSICIYALGIQLTSRTAGIIAFISLLVMPDSSLYWFKNGFLGFHYVLRVAPGTGFGIAICLASMIFFAQGIKSHQIRFFAVSLFLAAVCFFFRAHFFVLYFPVLVAMLAVFFFSHKRWFKPLIIFSSISLIVILIAASFNHTIRTFYFEKSAVLPFLDLIHLERGQTAYTSIFKQVTSPLCQHSCRLQP